MVNSNQANRAAVHAPRAATASVCAFSAERLLMERRPADTDEQTYTIWLEIVRRLTPEQRLLNVIELSDRNRKLAKAGIAARHPEYAPQEVEYALRRWWWGDDLFARVHPHAPMLPP